MSIFLSFLPYLVVGDIDSRFRLLCAPACVDLDFFPAPYANEEMARYANNGALPPDLSLIVKARHGGEDYLWSLLTIGYRDAPVNAEPREGLYWNLYFPGNQIAMPKLLEDGGVDYEEVGDPTTEATASQMAKDVATFLAWASEPEHDERKKMGFQWVGGFCFLAVGMLYFKRYRWSLWKTRRLEFRVR